MRASSLALAAGVALPLFCSPVVAQREPVRIVFDTDMGNDIDDALALAILHALASRGECELIAVTLTKDNRYSAPFVDIVDTFYGRGEVPVGVCRSGVTPEDGSYTKAVVEAADADRPRYARTQSDFPDAVTVLRRALVGVPDHSAAAVQVGFSTNLANLLASQPDAISPLSGMDLVRSKVRLLSIMAGTFSGRPEDADFGEYNVVGDLPATHRLIEQWPTEIVISGFEVGNALLYPARSIERDFAYVAHHPIPEAYAAYMKMPYDRPTWDLTAALYAVRPDAGYFDLSVPGRIAVNDQGHTSFTEDPAGHHRYLKIPPGGSARILEAMQLLASQPPGG